MLRRGFKTWCEKAALGFRRDLNLRPDAKLDPRRLAQHLGIPIWAPDQIPGLNKRFVRQLLETDSDSWSAATLVVGRKTVILNNCSHEAVRQNSNLAHELAHVILKHPPGQVFVTADHEEEAGCFSGTLLVARQALLSVLAQRVSEADAAKHFAVSVDLLRMRRNLTGVTRQLARRSSG